jgi:hypothetical protein
MMEFRRSRAKDMRELHHMTALRTINSAIANSTKAAEATADEEARAKILAHVAKLHKIAEKYEKMYLPEEDKGGGDGNSEPTAPGESY